RPIRIDRARRTAPSGDLSAQYPGARPIRRLESELGGLHDGMGADRAVGGPGTVRLAAGLSGIEYANHGARSGWRPARRDDARDVPRAAIRPGEFLRRR